MKHSKSYTLPVSTSYDQLGARTTFSLHAQADEVNLSNHAVVHDQTASIQPDSKPSSSSGRRVTWQDPPICSFNRSGGTGTARVQRIPVLSPARDFCTRHGLRVYMAALYVFFGSLVSVSGQVLVPMLKVALHCTTFLKNVCQTAYQPFHSMHALQQCKGPLAETVLLTASTHDTMLPHGVQFLAVLALMLYFVIGRFTGRIDSGGDSEGTEH